MKLRDLARKDKKAIKQLVKDQKRKNLPPQEKTANMLQSGLGDNAMRGMNDVEPPI